MPDFLLIFALLYILCVTVRFSFQVFSVERPKPGVFCAALIASAEDAVQRMQVQMGPQGQAEGWRHCHQGEEGPFHQGGMLVL